MTVTTIRKKVINYVADMDEKKLKAVYSIFEDEIEKQQSFVLSKEHVEILNNEREKHLSGQSKSYSWQEAKKIITTK